MQRYDQPSPIVATSRPVQDSPMSLWLTHLLEDPGLGLELVAGSGGLTLRGPIRWVHSSEIPDPSPWLEGGEVLLTTGMGVVDSPALQRKLIAGLDMRGCAAVGFGVGIWTDEVPDAMREEADARDLPLFSVPYEVPFIAVTKRISRHIFDEHYATLRSAVDLHRRVLATVLGGSGPDAVLSTVGRSLPGHSFVLFDYFGATTAGDTARVGVDPMAIWEAMAPMKSGADRVDVALPGHVAVAAPIRLGDQVEGYLVLLGEQPPLDHELLLFEQALTGVSMALARGQSTREAHRVRVDDLIDEVVNGRLGVRATAARMIRLGVDSAAGYAVLCVRRDAAVMGESQLRNLAAVVEDALAAIGPPVVGRADGAVQAIVPVDPTAADRVASAVRRRGWTGVAVGRSRVRHDADGLATALRESRVAAASAAADGDEIRDIGVLGLSGLLAGMDDSHGTEAFVDHVLGPVIERDRTEGGGLVDTLRAYQQHGCRPGPAAEELQIHRHTLAYRLDRIRELTGRDPRDGEHLLAFGLALALAHRRQSGSGEPA